MTKSWLISGIAALCAIGAVAIVDNPAWATGVDTLNVTTYHYDNYRTGWNPNETVLTPASVRGTGTHGLTFQMTSFTTLNDQVDTQPLIMTNQAVTNKGTHNVVYVTTESDTVYMLDADSGQILRSRTLGSPVPMGDLPGGCNNNGPNVGIDGTPVIDATNGVMYVIVFELANGAPSYRIHELNLESLDDAVAPVRITATGKLTNGNIYSFNPAVTRQRPALLLSQGTVYAGFGSFCDVSANEFRGWVLGWTAGTLAPLPANELTNKLAHDTDDFFLSAVWMSGYGLAADPSGDVYVVTGNSDPSGTTIDGVQNVAESALKLSADLTTVESLFTPGNAGSLDQEDGDFGSGGILLLPPQAGATSDFATALGKDGNLYFLNADNLSNSLPNPIGTYSMGGCWCGESYYTYSDGTGRVVTSANYNVFTWKVKTGASPSLVQEASTASIPGAQDPGFMTSVSTNGTTTNTGVIWAVSHADGSPDEDVWLYAFAASSGNTLYSAVAGTWPNANGNANLVPVVANGKVYVASYQGLAIFGLSSAAPATVPRTTPTVSARAVLPLGAHELYGIVRSINGPMLTVETRVGKTVTVDDSKAAVNFQMAEPSVGHGVLVRGTFGAGGVMLASSLLHAKDHPAMWLPDR